MFAGSCIPHVCGGDPKLIIMRNQLQVYSPCMWVDPIYVGLSYRISRTVCCIIQPLTFGIPHVYGGDPETIFNEMDIQAYSPYLWGQFTISTFFDSIQLRWYIKEYVFP